MSARSLRHGHTALAIAACLASGCDVERTIAVEPVESATSNAGSDASVEGSAWADATDATDAASPGVDSPSNEQDGPEDSADSSECTDPAFVSSSPFGIWSNGGYFVFNNEWNVDAGPGPQTIYACSYHNWYVVSNQPNNSGAVKTYPNVQMNFNEVPVRSFHGITSTFAETSPRVGIYEYAYDVWLNGIATAGSDQIEIWVESYNRVPAGMQVGTVTLSGRTYDVWKTADSSFIALVSTVTFTSGTLDLLEIFNWAIAQGWLAPGSTLGQIDFGVEIVSTAGASATYRFDDFSITTN